MRPSLSYPIAAIFIVVSLYACASSHPTTIERKDDQETPVVEAPKEQEDKDMLGTASEQNADSYENDRFGIAFQVPQGFEVRSLASEYPDETIGFFCCSRDTLSEATFTICQDILKFQDVSDEKSWAEAFIATYIAAMKEAGETDIVKSFGSVHLSGDLKGTACKLTSTFGDTTCYRDFYFMADDKGDGLRILLRANDEDTLKTLQQSLDKARP